MGTHWRKRYKIESLLRHETATEVWQARDIILRRHVLVRIVSERSLENSHFVARFVQDAQFLAQMEHPHIVPIYDYGLHEEIPYQVLRSIGIKTFEEVILSREYNPQVIDVMRFTQQIGDALDFIHNRGIVHRDVAAHNIIVDDKNQPYLANFSLARRIGAPDLLSGSNVHLVETIPEIDNDDTLSYRTDIFAFGLLLYQIFTGGAKPRYKRNEFLNDVRHYRPDLPIGVEIVLNRLTRYKREERYANLREAVNDLYHAFYSGQKNIEGKLFISYARKDSEYVHNLAEELRRIGLDIWIDQDIQPGANWDEAIENGLNACDMMLLITTETSMSSEYVTHEWSYVMGGGKPVYPFIPHTPIPDNIHARLKRVQYIVGTGDLLNDVAKIVDMLAGGTPNRV